MDDEDEAVTVSLGAGSTKGILLDVEGTTTPISFVHDVLFPFARTRLRSYLEAHGGSSEVLADLAKLAAEHHRDLAQGLAPPPWPEGLAPLQDSSSGRLAGGSAGRQSRSPLPRPREFTASIESAVAYVQWLMDRDRKSTGLKSLQGKIWRQGYLDGDLTGRLFPDVPPALREWHGRGLDVRIFSSGSVLAQKLLFGHSEAGDLTSCLSGFFDTTTGSKTAPESYGRIAGAFGLPPARILFLSDVTAELDAARSAGLQTLHCLRPGNRAQSPGAHSTIETFAAIVI